MRLWRELRDIFTDKQSLQELLDPHEAGATLRRGALLIREIVRSIRRDDSLIMAAALAFRTLLALVPVLAIGLAIVAMLDPTSDVSGDISYTERFIRFLRSNVPDFAGSQELIHSIRQFADNARTIAGVGFLFLFWAAFTLMSGIERAFNDIWQVKDQRRLLSKFTAYVATVMIVPVLMSMSVYLTSKLETAAQDILQRGPLDAYAEWQDAQRQREQAQLPDEREQASPPSPDAEETAGATEGEADPGTMPAGEPPAPEMKNATPPDEKATEREQSLLLQMLLVIVSILITCGAMTTLYYLLPNTPVKLRAALAGGVFAGIVLEGGKYGFRYYANNLAVNYTKIYGPLLAIPLFLLWLYILWVVILIGVEIAFTVQNFRNLAIKAELERRGVSSRLYHAVRIVLRASRYFRRGEAPSEFVDHVAEEIGIPQYMVREIVSDLVRRNILRRVEDHQDDIFLPAKDIHALTVAEVVDAIQSDKLDVPGTPDDPVRAKLVALFDRVQATKQETLGHCTFADLVAVDERWRDRPPSISDEQISAPGRALSSSEHQVEEPQTKYGRRHDDANDLAARPGATGPTSSGNRPLPAAGDDTEVLPEDEGEEREDAQ